MRTRLPVTLVLVALTLAVLGGPALARGAQVFTSQLSGADIPEAVEDTDGTGTTVLRVTPASDGIDFVFQVRRIDEVLEAHVHVIPADAPDGTVIGPPVGMLFDADDIPLNIAQQEDSEDGPITVQGTIDQAAILAPGPGVGVVTPDDLIVAMREGRAYTNVHTVDHPGGEIRGDVVVRR